MAVKKDIRADQVRAGMLIVNSAYRVGHVLRANKNSEGLIRVVWCEPFLSGADKYDHYLPGDLIKVVQGAKSWPSPLSEADRPLEWQKRGLTYTATGYGTKIPTRKVVRWSDGKVRRVYCDTYSNVGSCYCMIHGCKVSVDGFDLISGATK